MKRENTKPRRKSCQCWVCAQRSVNREPQASTSSDTEGIFRTETSRPPEQHSNSSRTESCRNDEEPLANKTSEARSKSLAMGTERYFFEPNAKYPGWALFDFLACLICYEVMAEACLTNCGHNFCRTCVSRWQARKGRCPVCNTRIRTITRCFSLDKLIDSISHKLPRYTQEKLAAAERFRLSKAIRDINCRNSLRGRAGSLAALWRSKIESASVLPSCKCSSCSFLAPCYVVFGLGACLYDLVKSALNSVFRLNPLGRRNQVFTLVIGLLVGIALTMLLQSCKSTSRDTYCAYLMY